MEHFANHQISIKRSNHLLELCYDSIKLLLSQKPSTSFSWIEPVLISTGRNNFNTKHRNCFISSTSFSTCTCTVQQKQRVENYKTLYGIVPLEKLLGRATRRPAKDTISRPLLWEVTYGMLPLPLIMQRLF